MKATFYIIIFILIGFSSCNSRDDKIKNIVTDDLQKVIIDIDSYSPIEMKIDSAFASAYTDSISIRYAKEIEAGMPKLEEISKDIDMEMDFLRISYSNGRYCKIKSLGKDMKSIIDKNAELSMKIYKRSKHIGNGFLGWKVYHSFRCRTSGGYMTIGEVMYIIDKDVQNILFKKIIDENEISYEKYIELALKTKGNSWEVKDE